MHIYVGIVIYAQLTKTFTVCYLCGVGFVGTHQTKSSEFISYFISISFFYIYIMMMHISLSLVLVLKFPCVLATNDVNSYCN